jgi:hypothetical protein
VWQYWLRKAMLEPLGQKHCTSIDYQSTRRPHGLRGLYEMYAFLGHGAKPRVITCGAQGTHIPVFLADHVRPRPSVCIRLIALILPHKIRGCVPLDISPTPEVRTTLILLVVNLNDTKTT